MTKTVVIGLDGANWDLIKPWLDNGDLPNIKSLLKNGVKADSYSYLPPVTVPSWKCYSTGKNPGKLNVYRFDHLDPKTHDYSFHRATDFESPEIWDYLNDEGYKTAVVNMPTTYPPRKIDGIMICGGPDARQGDYRKLDDTYTYPESLKKNLEEKYDYKIHPKPLISSKEEDGEEVDAIHELIDLRFRVGYDLFKTGEFDFLHVTSFYSNTLQHFFWREKPVYETWKIIDKHIGKFLEFEDTNIILMSDHGINKIDYVVYLNHWLEQKGYLSLEKSFDDYIKKTGITKEKLLKISKKLGLTEILADITPESLQDVVPWEEGVRGKRTFEKIDWDNTIAFANAQGLIYLTVDEDDERYEELRSEIKSEIENIEDPNGKPIAKKVYFPEEVYGENSEKSPDIIVYQSGGIHISEATGVNKIFHKEGRWEAENIPKGIFAATGPDIDKQGEIEDIKISDIAPTVLRLMTGRIPQNMEGDPLDVCSNEFEYRSPFPSPYYKKEVESIKKAKEKLADLGV